MEELVKQIRQDLQETRNFIHDLEYREIMTLQLTTEVYKMECDIKECKDEAKAGNGKSLMLPIPRSVFKDEKMLMNYLNALLPQYDGKISLQPHKYKDVNGYEIELDDMVDIVIKSLNKVEI